HQLRAVRYLRRSPRRLAGVARPRRTDPRDGTGRLAARVDRQLRRHGGVPSRAEGGSLMTRTGRVERETAETKVLVELGIDGRGATDVSTGIGFYDHMLASFGKHGLFDLRIAVEGDLHVDAHHTVEDTAIALGQAFAQAAGDKAGVRRFGDALIPMDEALVQ